MDFSPLVRIALRYLVGAGLIGSTTIGDKLAADPDLVFYGSIATGFLVETAYALAKKWNKAT